MPNWGPEGPRFAGPLATWVDLASTAGCDLLNKLRGDDSSKTTTTLVLPALLAVVTWWWRFSSRRFSGFSGLRSKPVGAGKEGGNWVKDGRASAGEEVQVTWLSARELRVLEAMGDTLLPGFEIGTKEDADAVVEQAVDMVQNNLFPAAALAAPGKGGATANAPSPTPALLPPNVEAYIKAIARRCMAMHGRPGSDIGVAKLLAQAFETNISAEQRSGLRLLFTVLSTRAGALILTGRPVPFQAQSLAARHAVLKRWSVSRIGKLREAFQGVKRLTCSLYFSAHPDEARALTLPQAVETRTTTGKTAAAAAAAAATMAERKTNPNWIDIGYDPQHHRLSREGASARASSFSSSSSSSSSGGHHQRSAAAASSTAAGAAITGLRSGAAKVKGMMSTSPARLLPTNANLNSNSNPPSPASSSVPPASSFCLSAGAPPATAPPKLFQRARSKSSGSAAVATGTTGGTGTGSRACGDIPRDLDVDVVVVGSGAGGGCAAGALAARGLKVAVLEKGGLYGAKDFAQFSEMEAYKNLYEGQGVVATDDGAVVILAGSCVGGGTTVNWAASFRTPRHVRKEWARKLGLKSFKIGGPYDRALDVVCERLGVNTNHSHRAPGCPTPPASLRVNQHQSSLWNGAAASGRIPRPVPTNTEGCVDCGTCLQGCAYGKKRSTQTTWLQDGLASGNMSLVPNAKVDRVLVDAGRATGVEATVTPPEGGKATPLTVRARAVVVAGGAINTPAILLRSGLKHPMIGRHLCLHPVLLAGGVFPQDYNQGTASCGGDGEPDGAVKTGTPAKQGSSISKVSASASDGAKTKPKQKAGPALAGPEALGLCERVPSVGRGVMMGVYVQDLMRLDGGYGCVIEAPPAHPGLMGLVLPWNDALTHRLLVGMCRETSVFLCIGRDRSSNDNRVVLGPRGDPVIKYKLGKEDSKVILQGRSEMLRMMRKAGASMVVSAHEGAPWFCPEDGEGSDERFEEYVDTIESLGTTANEAGIYSAHQMGSCRLSANPEDGPLRESGETWECDGLFVADASVFPTSLGINPMITVEAVAYMVADQVATRLGKKTEDLVPRAASSPLRRKMRSFGKAVVAAMSREPSYQYTSDTGSSHLQDLPAVGTDGEGESGHGDVAAWDTSLPQSPVGVKATAKAKAKAKEKATNLADDFGVELGDLSW